MIDIFYYADFYAIGLLLILQTLFIVRAVRAGGVRGRRAAGAWAYFLGTFVTVALSFHVAENIWRIIPGTPVTDAVKPEYNFRFYALILFGVVMNVQGVSIMKASRALVFGNAAGGAARRDLLRHTLLVLALVVPLIPLQIFASIITILSGLNLAALALVNEKTADEDERLISIDALLEPKQLCLKINKAL